MAFSVAINPAEKNSTKNQGLRLVAHEKGYFFTHKYFMQSNPDGEQKNMNRKRDRKVELIGGLQAHCPLN